MAVTETPLGFQKPDGNELARNGDNVIRANADKAEQRHQEDRGRLTAIESKNTAQDTAITAARTNAVADAKTYTDGEVAADRGRLTEAEGRLDNLPNLFMPLSRGVLADGTDLNTLTGSAHVGAYSLLTTSTHPNAPAYTSTAVLEVQRGSGNALSVVQRVTAGDALYWREVVDAGAGTWSAWTQAATTTGAASGSAQTLTDAKAYADAQDASIRTTERALWRTEDDGHQAAAEANAKTYTDGQVATDRGRITTLEADTLRLKPALGTVNLDTVQTAGIYPQDSAASALLSRSYPVNGRGFLTVTVIATDKVAQTYNATTLGQVYTRELTGGVWSAWTSPAVRLTALETNAVQFKGNISTENLDTITTPGIYHQSSSSTPTTALNYPLSGRGDLTVTKVTASIVGQQYWATFLKRLFVREYTGTVWSAWTEIGGTSTGGGTSGAFLVKGNLGAEDLNTITTPGIYGQATSGTATLARNYPVDASGRGILTVKNVSVSIVSQEYNATFLQKVFYREYSGTVWNAWKEVGSGGGADPALTARVTTAENNVTTLNNEQDTQDGRLTSLEALNGLGNPVTGANVTGEGLLTFTLADATVTPGVPLPASPPTSQADYVEQVRRHITTGTVEVKKVNTLGGLEVSAVAPNGDHTTYEFKGASSGPTDDDYKMQQRIWVGDSTGSVRNKTYRVGPSSNRDFAIQIAPAGSGFTPAFVPDHGDPTAFNVEPPQYYGAGALIDVAAMTVGQVITINGSFQVVQHVMGRHPSAPATDLLEFWTTQTITPDRRLAVDGKWRAVQDVTLGSNYHLMCPVDATIFDTVTTSLNNKYLNTADKYGTSTYLPIESDVATSYVFTSSTNDGVAVAFRYNNVSETMRRGRANKTPVATRTFLQHRDADILKLYNMPYASGTTVPAGTVQRFSGDYLYTSGRALHSQLSG